MQRIKFLIVFSLIITAFCACSHDSTTVEPNIALDYKVLSNVSYGSDPNQVYDIYLPKNRTLETKTIVLVHGGGWNAGDKADMAGFKDFLRDQLPHIAVVNLNYRLADENNAPFPMQIDDITAVIAALTINRDAYQIGKELGFVGASAGGHLSLLWSYSFDLEQQVKMVCSIVGPTNLADEVYLNSTNQELRNLIFQFGTDLEQLKNVSPFYKAKTSSPPTILFYGAQDPLIPVSQGSDMNDKLSELNVTHEFTLYPNGGHGWIGLDLLDTSIKLKAFIDNHL